MYYRRFADFFEGLFIGKLIKICESAVFFILISTNFLDHKNSEAQLRDLQDILYR
jgi:hypothetical protein